MILGYIDSVAQPIATDKQQNDTRRPVAAKVLVDVMGVAITKQQNDSRRHW